MNTFSIILIYVTLKSGRKERHFKHLLFFYESSVIRPLINIVEYMFDTNINVKEYKKQLHKRQNEAISGKKLSTFQGYDQIKNWQSS